MMKVITLLLVTTLTLSIFNCQSASQNSPISTSSNDSDAPIFLRISETLSAHARLTISLHVLAEMIKPTNEMAAFTGLLNMDDSIANDLIHIGDIQAEKVVKELKDLEAHMFNAEPHLDKIKILEVLRRKMKMVAPFPSMEEKEQMYKTMNDWMAVKDHCSTIMDKLESNMQHIDVMVDYDPYNPNKTVKSSPAKFHNSTKASTVISNAASALINIPVELGKMPDRIPILAKTENFGSVFYPIMDMANLLSHVKNTTIADMELTDVTKMEHLVSKSSWFKKASEMTKSLEILSNFENRNSTEGRKWTGAFPNEFLDLDMMKNDLNGSLLMDSLNKGKELYALKMVIAPLLKLNESIRSSMSDFVRTMGSHPMKADLGNFSHLLNHIAASGFSVHNLNFTKENSTLLERINRFTTAYESIANGIKEYQGAMEMMKTVEASDEFKSSSIISDLAAKVASSESDVTKFVELQNKVTEWKNTFTRMALVNITNKLNSAAYGFQSISTFKELTDTLEMEIDPFKKQMDQKKKLVARFKSGLTFVKEYKEVTSEGVFKHFTEYVANLEKGTKNAMAILHTQKEWMRSLIEEPYYEHVIFLNDHFKLKKKLMAGSILFKLFNDVLENRVRFTTFFDSGARLQKELARNASWDVFHGKMKGFNSMSDRFEEMEKEILKKKGFYEPEPLEELIQVRWLVENLDEITNPKLKVNEWKELAEKMDETTPGLDEFKDALKGIFDLDFANHQKNVKDAYANLRGLKRFHLTIDSLEKVSHHTWWDYNHQYVKIGGFVFTTLLAYGLLYGYTLYSFRKQEEEDKLKEEMAEYEYYKRMAQRQEDGEDSDEEEYIRTYLNYRKRY